MKKVEKKGKTCFVCQMCYFMYHDKEQAERCEVYCASHNACDTEMIKHAIGNLNEEEKEESKEPSDEQADGFEEE